MQKTKENLSELKNNSKGFSLIELIVVVAMIVALTSLTTGSFVTLSHARANKAANSLDSMIAQSKVNALSGQENVLIVKYDASEDSFVAELHNLTYDSVTDSYNMADGYYENMVLGNTLLHIFEGTNQDKELNEDGTNDIQIKFNGRNGKLEYFKVGSTEIDASKIEIHVKFGSDNIIELWRLTGEHHVV